MANLIKEFCCDESGATAIEYGLIVALVGVGIIVSLTNFRIALADLFGEVVAQVPTGSDD